MGVRTRSGRGRRGRPGLGRRMRAFARILGAGALAAVVAGVLATGWGVGGPVDTGGAPAAPAPRTTPGPALYDDVARRMVAAGTADFVFSGTGGGQTVSGSGVMRFVPDGFDASVQLTMRQSGRVQAVLGRSTSYLALPAAKGLPKTKPWVAVPPEPRTEVGRSLVPVVEQLRGAFDPEQSLGLIRLARRVEEVGPATVEGVSTTRYRADVDLRRAVRAVVGPAREQYRSMLDAGVRTLRYDVWVDVTGLPRRYSARLPTAQGLFSVTGVYRDWGQPWRIDLPKPDQVFDADKLPG